MLAHSQYNMYLIQNQPHDVRTLLKRDVYSVFNGPFFEKKKWVVNDKYHLKIIS